MLAAPALNECLLDLALQRSLPGFQQALKRVFDELGLAAWTVVFPPAAVVGSRPVLMAHGIRADRSPMLALASRVGMESLFPPEGMQPQQLAALAREMTPDPACRFRILRTKREKGGEFVMFCYRQVGDGDFADDDVATLARIGRVLDRCFAALAHDQENEFEAGLFRLVGNLHPEGLCVLDNRLRVLFENRRFKEQMLVWNRGLRALQNMTLPKQSELPAVWKDACDRSFQAFREVKFPPVSGKMVVTQGSLSTLKKAIDTENWMEGAVRYLAFQSPLGVRPYLILTCAFRHRQPTAGAVSVARIADRHGFSRRETELAELIVRGSSARQIADELKIAMPTVKTHIRHILHKAGVKTRLQFVGLCHPQG